MYTCILESVNTLFNDKSSLKIVKIITVIILHNFCYIHVKPVFY